MDYSVLKALADQIANEKADEANSAIRIGGWMQNLLLWLSVHQMIKVKSKQNL